MNFNEVLKINPKVCEIEEFNPVGEYGGIKAITYEAMPIDEKRTKVFAYIGYPANITQKVPAIVLVHGGCGTPYLPWIKMWNERGYAAIAMSTTGDFPTEVNAGIDPGGWDASVCSWHHGLYGSFSEEGFADAPDNDGMKNSDKEYDKQWMYHAVCQTILAHNILRADKSIDKNRIGICGVSWGGVITSIVIGYDTRFAFAVPIYGSGYLVESMGSVRSCFRNGGNLEPWLAEKRFSNVKIPVLWLCWNKDKAFSLNSNSKSYIDTSKNSEFTRLSSVNEMYHSHEHAWVRKEPFAFADSVCCCGKKTPVFKDYEGALEIYNPDKMEVISVKLYYITEPMSYFTYEQGGIRMAQDWKIADIKYDGDKLKYIIPEKAREYYFELTCKMDGEEYVTCSYLMKQSNAE